MIWTTLFILAIISFVYSVIRKHRYWTERGVSQGSLLFTLNDYYKLLARKEDPFTRLLRFHKLYEKTRYYGLFLFGSPILMLQDPELIKEITVKNFDSFPNHNQVIPEHDELWSKNLFALRDQKWREMRTTLSPVFTSSKIKQMFVLMDEIAQQFCDFFLKQNQTIIKVEMKDTFTRFANDVIASTAFGIKCDSLEEPNNEFYEMGKKATDFKGLWRAISLTLLQLFPSLGKKSRFKFFPEDVGDFFKKLVAANIEERERKNIIRPDLINLLMETRRGTLKDEDGHVKHPKMEMTNTDITAQALIFFFAGFDSVSTFLCFTSHELAVNPDVQEKLRQEVDEIASICNGKPSYDAINKMKYLDMVVSESLRKWPPTVAMDRNCSKTFIIKPKYPDEKPVVIEKGINVWYPIGALHHNPEFFPNPGKFDPERFSDENKPKIKSGSYLPFGSGPRNCIGSRFALIEAKILFFHILNNFEIVTVEETQNPLKISKKSFTSAAEKGFWLGLKRREKSFS